MERLFGPFRLQRRVGQGGLGAVWRAVDSRSGAVVAVKLLRLGDDPRGLGKLRREFEEVRRVRHPNVVRLMEVGEQQGIPWLAMELVEGLGIREWLAIAGRPEPLESEATGDAHGSEGVDLDALFDEPDSGSMIAAVKARRLMTLSAIDQQLQPERQREVNAAPRLVALCDVLAQVCDGLGEIHARGLVHRDVKPGNVIVDGARRAVVVDFGLVQRMTDEMVSDAGRVVGTYRYMSPEQARGERVDGRADLYSVGTMLYELLAGRPPFPQSGNMALLEAVVGEMPTDLPSINPGAPHALAALAHRLLSKSPMTRPQTAAEVAFTLRSVGRRILVRGQA